MRGLLRDEANVLRIRKGDVLGEALAHFDLADDVAMRFGAYARTVDERHQKEGDQDSCRDAEPLGEFDVVEPIFAEAPDRPDESTE